MRHLSTSVYQDDAESTDFSWKFARQNGDSNGKTTLKL